VAKLADARDLKSRDPKGSCGFDPRPRHQELTNYRGRRRIIARMGDSPTLSLGPPADSNLRGPQRRGMLRFASPRQMDYASDSDRTRWGPWPTGVYTESAQPPHAEGQALIVPALIRVGLVPLPPASRPDDAGEARAEQE
jgi:hypothetical protein